MCGIVGLLRGRSTTAFDMPAALAALAHRGPDAQTSWEDGGVALGHTRLSIIDLATGDQPMRSPCGRWTIVFNGEIYNFADLRDEATAAGWTFRTRSDTEVLLALFATLGLEACLTRLRGMFAFAVWDAKTGELSLARDRLGVKPLVYTESGGAFAFASEIGGLRALLPGLARDIDPIAIDHYFTYRYIPSPLTAFRAVRKLPPAHAMVVGPEGIRRIWRWWQVDPTRRLTLSPQEAREAVTAKIAEATRLRMIADVPVGAFLSGGIDSSVTVAAMAETSERPVLTFAVGFSDDRFDERPYARAAAAHLGTDHREILVEADATRDLPMLIRRCGEPFGDDSLLPTHLVARAARSEVTVALTGDGGDEAFGGYRRHLQLARIAEIERRGLLPAWRAMRRLSTTLEGVVRPDRRRPFPFTREDRSLFHDARRRHLDLIVAMDAERKASLYTAGFESTIAGADVEDWFDAQRDLTEGAGDLGRVLLTDTYTYLPEDVLFKVDIASMATALECRSPFLDHEVVELAAALPPEAKIRGRRGKCVLRDAYADRLPPGHLERNKQGFSSPVAKWLRGDLAGLLQERLIAERRLDPWLEPAKVDAMVTDHLSGAASHARDLWSFLVMAEWLAECA